MLTHLYHILQSDYAQCTLIRTGVLSDQEDMTTTTLEAIP